MNSDPAANSLGIWNRNATYWDEFLGEGNDFQRTLIMPATDRLLELRPGNTVLDIACGNGNYARRMAAGGAIVTAFDGAESFIEHARKRTLDAGLSIEFRTLDATRDDALAAVPDRTFDAAVCSMALMDFEPLEPVFRMVTRVLKPGGRFVFSLPHPCFNSNAPVKTAELIENNGRHEHVYGLKVTRYRTPFTALSLGLLHQPEPHPLFHRTLEAVFALCFQHGLLISGLEEPAFPPGLKAKAVFAWQKRPEIPPAIVIRAVLAP